MIFLVYSSIRLTNLQNSKNIIIIKLICCIKSIYRSHMISQYLAANESKRNSDISPHCQHCTNYKETATHFLGECPAYSNTRYKIFEETSITMTELLKHKPQKIMEFVKKSGRLSNYEITDDSQIADT